MKKIIFIVLIIFVSAPALAVVIGPTNFGLSSYPDHRCFQPTKPITSDAVLWNHFKIQVSNYTQCIEDYVTASKYDQERILEKANSAIDEYNSFITFLQSGY